MNPNGDEPKVKYVNVKLEQVITWNNGKSVNHMGGYFLSPSGDDL